MDDIKEYQAMLEMETNTSNVVVKKGKKRRKKVNDEEVKAKLIEKVNSAETVTEKEPIEKEEQTSNVHKKEKNKKPSISVIFGIVLVVGLFATILVTNYVTPNSGINTLIKSVFSPNESTKSVDNRVYSDFDLTLPTSANLDNGVITLSDSGSVYSLVNGKIASIERLENGKYAMTIKHSENFLTKVSGLDFVYGTEGDKVYSTLPVGYSKTSGVNLSFYDGDSAVIVNYTIDSGAIKWS